MISILIAEDEEPIREGLEDLLQGEGYSTLSAAEGKGALQLFLEKQFDLVLLDIMMPGLSGYEVCREIRKTDSRVPVIFLSAREEEIDKVVGLELGADDYIVKPFGVRELTARIRTVLRRAERTFRSDVSAREPFTLGGCKIEPSRLLLARGGRIFDLSRRELELLIYFHEHPGVVLSRDHLLSTFWGIEYGGTTRTLDQHIAKLRGKLEENSSRPRHILTVHGIGYRFQTE